LGTASKVVKPWVSSEIAKSLLSGHSQRPRQDSNLRPAD
jgi:hypothetical protein